MSCAVLAQMNAESLPVFVDVVPMGVAVFAGMIGVTVFGLILTPVFYYLLRSKTKAVVSQDEGNEFT